MSDDEDEDDQYQFDAVIDLMKPDDSGSSFEGITAMSGGLAHPITKEEMKQLAKEQAEIPEEERPETKGFEKGDPLGVFFNIAKRVQGSCETMVTMHGLYKKAALELTQSIDPDSEKAAQSKLDKIVGRAKDEISGVKAVLDQMDKICKKQKAADDEEAKEAGVDDPSWTTIYRVMYNCKWSLLFRWREVNKAYNEEQASCERRRRQKLTRQMTIANDGIAPDPQEIEERLANNSTDVFSGGMVAAKSADEDFAAEFLAEAKEKEAALDEILAKAKELQELWDQFQLLLQRQGELLNQIGANLEKCKDFVAQANADLDTAIEYQQAALQKQMMMVGVCIVMIAILLVPMMIM